NKLKSSDFSQKMYNKLGKITTSISPRLNAEISYFIKNGKRINLNNPKNFEEKLVWLKLNDYNNNELVVQCSDKYRVRDYIKKQGCGMLLNDLYDVWEHPNEIDWNSLPESFVLKYNFGAGYNIICDSKENLNIKEAKDKLISWYTADKYKSSGELHYDLIKRKIICEKYLDTNQGFLPWDYKLYCFNGEVRAILVMMDRDKEIHGAFMTKEWEFIATPDKYKDIKVPEKPTSLDTMIEAATILSEPFPFVRVDFYQYEDKAIFGEMTFTPAGGIW